MADEISKAFPRAILLLTSALPVASVSNSNAKKKKSKELPDLVEGSGIFLLAGEPAKVEILKTLLLDTLKGKGGGRPGRFQGNVDCLENIPGLVILIRENLEKYL